MNQRLVPWEVIEARLENPKRAFESGKITADGVTAYKAYMRSKDLCQELCRARIFARDANRCRACQMGVGSLALAHITRVWDFVEHTGNVAKLLDAYTESNMVALCWRCHASQHARGPLTGGGGSGAGWVSIGFLLGSRTLPKEPPEQKCRRARVEALFSTIIQARGWRTAKDYYALPRRETPLGVRLAGALLAGDETGGNSGGG